MQGTQAWQAMGHRDCCLPGLCGQGESVGKRSQGTHSMRRMCTGLPCASGTPSRVIMPRKRGMRNSWSQPAAAASSCSCCSLLHSSTSKRSVASRLASLGAFTASWPALHMAQRRKMSW